MMSFNNAHINQLRRLNLSLRAQLELAEAQIPIINDLIDQISNIELLTETFILGLVIFERNYSDLTGPHSSGQVLQAALAVPGGLGVILWDSEAYAIFRQKLEADKSDLPLIFVPFDDCVSAIKALLLPHVESLLERLMQKFPRINSELN